MTTWLAAAVLVAAINSTVPETAKAPPAEGSPTAPDSKPPTAASPVDNAQKPKDKATDRDAGLSFGANQISGRVQSLDSTQKAIVIEQNGQRQSLKLTDDTTVFVEGRLGSALDLKEGEQVRAAFETDNGSRNLRWIEVAPAKAKSGSSQNEKPFVGHIAAIDREAQTVTVSHGDDSKVLAIGAGTRILKKDGEGSFSDLKQGQEVRASLVAVKPACEKGNCPQPSKSDTFATSSIEITINPVEPAPAEKPPAKTQPPDVTY